MGKFRKLESKNCELGSPIWKYARMLEEKRGSNFEYYNEEKHENLINNKGWQWYRFKNDEETTRVQDEAKQIVTELRETNHFARIVCGLEKDRQKTKYYSIIYKPKK